MFKIGARHLLMYLLIGLGFACRKIESASRSDSAIASLLEHLESQVTRGDQRV